MFDWKKYLTFAKVLARLDGKSESAQRTAASRAYYAIYHLARENALSKGWVEEKENSHASLAAWHRNKFGNVDYQEIGRLLISLRRMRVKCDYADEVSNLQGNVSLAIEDADAAEALIVANRQRPE